MRGGPHSWTEKRKEQLGAVLDLSCNDTGWDDAAVDELMRRADHLYGHSWWFTRNGGPHVGVLLNNWDELAGPPTHDIKKGQAQPTKNLRGGDVTHLL